MIKSIEIKYNILIVDDEQSSINTVKKIIAKAGLLNYLNIDECLYVQQGNTDETLSILLPKRNRIDIAIIDWFFKEEFDKQAQDGEVEAGGIYATNMIREKFHNCKIIFATNFPLDAKDARLLSKYDAILLKKETDNISIARGKERLEQTIQECVKQRLFEISANELSKKQCFAAIQSDTINWNTTITIDKENWTFENLFFIYKGQQKEEINNLIKKHLVRFPKINKRKDVDRWNQATGLYKSPLKDYYSLLYIDYYSDLVEITNKAESFLDELLELLLLYLKDKNDNNLKDLKNNLLAQAESICDIRADVRKISDNKYIAFQDFKKKLVVRLICITSYCCFKMTVVSILYLFTKSDYLQNNNVKMISNFLFIYGMCYDEQQSDFEKFLHECSKHRDIKNLTTYEPADREYNKILGTPEQTGSCSDYELDFISTYFNEKKIQIQNKEEAVKSYFSDTFKVLEEANVLKQRYN